MNSNAFSLVYTIAVGHVVWRFACFDGAIVTYQYCTLYVF